MAAVQETAAEELLAEDPEEKFAFLFEDESGEVGMQEVMVVSGVHGGLSHIKVSASDGRNWSVRSKSK